MKLQKAEKSKPVQLDKTETGDEERKEEPVSKSKLPVISKQSNLPPLVSQKYDKDIEDLQNEKQKIDDEIKNQRSALDRIKNAKVEE